VLQSSAQRMTKRRDPRAGAVRERNTASFKSALFGLDQTVQLRPWELKTLIVKRAAARRDPREFAARNISEARAAFAKKLVRLAPEFCSNTGAL